MRKLWLVLFLACMVLGVTVACSVLKGRSGGNGSGGMETPSIAQSPREITGTEALKLYGVETRSTATVAVPTSTPQFWFPAKAWVKESILPYDPTETIRFLPMYSRPDLDTSGTWLGDLAAETEVMLLTVSEDWTVCFVEGPVIQGWTTKGWVACNRLRFK